MVIFISLLKDFSCRSKWLTLLRLGSVPNRSKVSDIQRLGRLPNR